MNRKGRTLPWRREYYLTSERCAEAATVSQGRDGLARIGYRRIWQAGRAAQGFGRGPAAMVEAARRLKAVSREIDARPLNLRANSRALASDTVVICPPRLVLRNSRAVETPTPATLARHRGVVQLFDNRDVA